MRAVYRTYETRRKTLLHRINGRLKVGALRNFRNELVFSFALFVCLASSVLRINSQMGHTYVELYVIFWGLRMLLVGVILWRCMVDERDRRCYPITPRLKIIEPGDNS